jgi:23S rRNA (uracil1939-C5)-methyltransferase
MARRRRKSAKLDADPVVTSIESLSHDGRGITHINDKVVFIDGALAGEKISFRYIATHRNFDEGRVEEVLEPSADRADPHCQFHALCGGCSMQHMLPEKQIQSKQEILINLLTRTGQVVPEHILEPLVSDFWGYRSKARLGVRFVNKKQRVLVGFREKHSAYLADMDCCEVLDPRVGHKIEIIAECIQGLQAYNKIAQIEVATTEEVVALVFRNLVELDEGDRQRLVGLAREQHFHIYLQPGGPESVHLLYPETSVLSYQLPDFDLTLRFLPTDFTQINSGINRQMVRQALDLLELSKEDQVLDLFCGLGNFSLPIATRAGHVVGIEGDEGLIFRARENAQLNGIDNTEFFVHDLTHELADVPWAQRYYNKILIDPARPGALEVMQAVANIGPERIVYVSCNPATLARDAGELVNRFGYKLDAAGVMDMFPHTAHVESMALFVRK